MAPQVPKSKAPLVVLVGVIIFASVGVGYLALRPVGPSVVEAKREPEFVPPVQPAPQGALDPNAEAMKLLREQQQRSREENARIFLGKGRTEFEVAKLDEAETYLKAVAPEAESAKDARALLEKIGAIREKLKSAALMRSRGQCDQALPLYRAVLDINGKVKDALDGANDCRRSMVNTTME